ncbi:hypothetical protein [Roseococcus sp. YIM B11640]
MDFVDPTHPDLAGALLALLWASAVAAVLTLTFPRENTTEEDWAIFWLPY